MVVGLSTFFDDGDKTSEISENSDFVVVVVEREDAVQRKAPDDSLPPLGLAWSVSLVNVGQ